MVKDSRIQEWDTGFISGNNNVIYSDTPLNGIIWRLRITEDSSNVPGGASGSYHVIVRESGTQDVIYSNDNVTASTNYLLPPGSHWSIHGDKLEVVGSAFGAGSQFRVRVWLQ